jgi:hypothetical protein
MDMMRRTALSTAIAVMLIGVTGAGNAAVLSDSEDLTVRLDTNLAYTLGARTSHPAEENSNVLAYPGAAFVNDGDAAFKRYGLINNRVDLSLQFDARMKDKYRTGLRVSTLAWYDQVYHRAHEPIPAGTYNATSVSNTEFTPTAKRMAGGDLELYDAFVQSGIDLGDHGLSFRLGRHTLIWGESLFLGSNGIASGMAPVNAIKALSVPIAEAKEIFMPVNQLSATFGITPNISLQGFYQLEYREVDVSPPGTYWSTADFVFQGAETFVPGVIARGNDIRPKRARGNWGLAMKFSLPEIGWDTGVYYVRYSDRTPQIYLSNGGATFQFVYPRNVEVFGASASTSLGDANVAGEISYRRNQSLFANGGALFSPGPLTDAMADEGALQPKAETFHYQASTIWVLPRLPLWDSSSLAAEIGGNHVVKVTDNAALIDPTRSKNMAGAALIYTPTFYQLVGSADVDFPISLGYNFTKKKSLIDGSFNGGVGGRSGKLGLGMKFKYGDAWRAALTWTKFLGGDNQNQYGDRDFLAFNVNYSF